MMVRIGDVQSTSSVDFFGIEIVGDCAIVVSPPATVVASGKCCGGPCGCVESKLPRFVLTHILRGEESPMSFINGLLAGSLLAGGVCPLNFCSYWEPLRADETPIDLLLVLVWDS